MPPAQRRSRSPARSPALKRAAAAANGAERPPYHSDGDSRPVLRGRFYEVVNRSLARPLLTVYLLALGGFCYTGALTPVGLLCRLLHAAMLAANSILSDELHNCDKRLGSVYLKPQSKHGAALTAAELARGRTYPWAARLCGASNVTAVEGAVQLIDWMAAAGVPFVYHVVLYIGRLSASQRTDLDAALFAINVAAYAALAARCWPCAPARATRARIKSLFLHFVLTFAVQMLMVAFAFGRYTSLTITKGLVAWGWPALWLIYLVGLIAKGTERPRCDARYGYHEVLHLTTLLGNLFGLVLDCWDLAIPLPPPPGTTRLSTAALLSKELRARLSF